MSGSTTYDVVLRLHTTGDLTSRLTTIGQHADLADRHLRRAGDSGRAFGDLITSAGDRAGRALEGVADRAMDVGIGLAKWGAAAGAGLAAYGVAGLNNELERTQISLGAIAQAQGFAPDFARGFELASDQLARMKQDVKTLPGDLGQLSAIMTTIATPAAQAHASLDQIRQLAGRTMLTAAVLNVPQEVASREMAGLLSGRAGAHNILGTRLGLVGDEAKKFNELAPEARLVRINLEMSKYQGAADRFGESFIAQWTTLKDNIKYTLLAPVTAPLFTAVKHDLAEVNTYFDQHQQKIHQIVALVSDKLVAGWHSVEHAASWLAPHLEHAAEAIAKMDPSELIHKFEHLAEILIQLKLTGAGLRFGSNLLGAAMGGGGGFGRGGYGAASALAGGAAMLGPVGAGVVGAGIGLAGGTAYAAAEGIKLVADTTSRFHAGAADDMARTVENVRRLGPVAEHLETVFAGVGEYFTHFGERVGSGFDRTLREITERADLILGYLPAPPGSHPLIQQSDMSIPPSPFRGRSDQDWMDPWKKLQADDAKRARSGVNIGTQSIVINVSGSDDPGRVARLVSDHIERNARNPKSSAHVPRFDGGR